MRISKICVKNVFTVALIFVYLVLTAVAVFLAYQTISDFLEKLNQPVMSVTYQEVESFSSPGQSHQHTNAPTHPCTRARSHVFGQRLLVSGVSL